LLEQKDSNLANVNASMDQRLNEQQDRFMKENQLLKAELDSLGAQNQAETAQLLEQIAYARNQLQAEMNSANNIEQEAQMQLNRVKNQAQESISSATQQLQESANLAMSIEARDMFQKTSVTQQQVEDEIENMAAIFRAQKKLDASQKKLGSLKAKKTGIA